MPRHALPIVAMLLSLANCVHAEHEVALQGIDNNVAVFAVANRTAADLVAMNVELTFLTSSDSVILVDTVEYTAKKRDGSPNVFLGANDSTTIVQRVPDGATTAIGRILDVR